MSGSISKEFLDREQKHSAIAKKAFPKTVRRSQWLNDVREDGNLFLLETFFRLMGNFCAHYKGSLGANDIFAPVGKMMRCEKLMNMYFTCTTETLRKEFAECRHDSIKDPYDEDPKHIMAMLWLHDSSKPKFKLELAEWLRYAGETVAAWQVEAPDPAKSRFEELRKFFSLSDREVDVLIVATMFKNDIISCEGFMGKTTTSKINKYAALMGASRHEYLSIIGPLGKLRRLGCLDDDGDLNPDLLPYLTGMDDTPLASRYFKRNEEAALPWTFFGTLAERDGVFLKQLIAGRSPQLGLNILLYGEPGTGKTSFALALAAELGFSAYLIAQANKESESGKTFRFGALQVCDVQADPAKSLIVIDEADEMLGGGGRGGFLGRFFGNSVSAGDKGLLNDVLDTVKATCIWITNSPAETLDASNRRRFDYSIRFDKLTHGQRAAIWRNGVSKHGVGEAVPDLLVAKLAAKYEVSAGGIDVALRNLGSMLKGGLTVPAEAEKVLDTILTPHCQLLDIKGADTHTVDSGYSLEGLNIKGDISLPQIEAAVRRFLNEQGSITGKSLDKPRMNLLLSGPPGTGKTEFVKYLGAALGTHVVTRMGSDLLDKYVGGTEQNIKRAFAEAAAEKSILFLDEVDGLVQSRERAVRSWEVTQVNELLYQMENFEGVLVCATNFTDNLDPATMRRFTFKLSFEYLTEEGKRLFFRRMFDPMRIGEPSPSDEDRLRRIRALAPGDFRTVRQGLYYLGGDVTTSQIVEGLERESAAKRGHLATSAIGFRV